MTQRSGRSCPRCKNPVQGNPDNCPYCGQPLTGPQAAYVQSGLTPQQQAALTRQYQQMLDQQPAEQQPARSSKQAPATINEWVAAESEALIARLNDVMEQYFGGWDPGIDGTTVAEVRQQINLVRQAQNELKMIKRDAAARRSELHQHFASQIAQVGKTGGAIVGSMLFGKRNVGKVNTLQRDQLRRTELSLVDYFQRTERLIDQTILELDSLKTEAQNWILQQS